MKTAPNALSATEAGRNMREGRLSSVDLVKSCLTRIAETEPDLQAWAHLDGDAALAQAAEMADRPEFKRLELMVKEMQMQRETLVKAIKVDNDAQQDKPGDDD